MSVFGRSGQSHGMFYKLSHNLAALARANWRSVVALLVAAAASSVVSLARCSLILSSSLSVWPQLVPYRHKVFSTVKNVP